MKIQLDMLQKEMDIEKNIQKKNVSDDQVPLLLNEEEEKDFKNKKQEPLFRSRSASSASSYSTKKIEPSWGNYARMSVLGVTCYILLSAMMCDEVVAAAVPAIKESANLDSSQVGLLYSSSFVPSLTFVLLGGFLQHKIGVRLLSIGSSLLVVIGMVVFAMNKTFLGMIIGRVLFGFGLGPTELVNDIIALRWYDSVTVPSIEIAFGTIAAFGMIGFIMAFNLMPLFLHLFEHMTDSDALRMSVLCLAIVPAITVVINIAYIILDLYAAPILDLDYDNEMEPSILESIKQLPFPYWLLFTINASCFAMMYVIMLYSVDFMGEKWGYSNLTAGQFSSSVYIAGIFFSPFAGIIIHKFGNMLTLIFFGVVFFGAGCTIMGVTHLHPLVGLISIGTGLGLMETTLWTAVAEVVPDYCFGPAFAFLSASVSIVLVIIPFLAGWLHDHFNSYEPVAYLCAGSSVIGGICTIILYIVAPHLQKPSDKFKLYYIVKIVARKKRSIHQHRPRRHSIAIGEVKQIVGYLTENDAFEDLHPTDEPVNQPKMFDLLYSDDNERLHDTGSLPKDFFSKLVSHTATLIAVEEGHPEFEQAIDRAMLGESENRSEMQNEVMDLGRLLQITDSESKSRTVSEAPNVWMPEGSEVKKTRAISDVSQTNWRKNAKLTAKMEKSKTPEKRKTFFPDFLSPLRSVRQTTSKPIPISKDTGVVPEEEEEEVVWQPPPDPVGNLDRQRTHSDLTISNWGKYGRVRAPTAPSKKSESSGYFLGTGVERTLSNRSVRTPSTDLVGSYMNTPDGVEPVDIPTREVVSRTPTEKKRNDEKGW